MHTLPDSAPTCTDGRTQLVTLCIARDFFKARVCLFIVIVS